MNVSRVSRTSSSRGLSGPQATDVSDVEEAGWAAEAAPVKELLEAQLVADPDALLQDLSSALGGLAPGEQVRVLQGLQQLLSSTHGEPVFGLEDALTGAVEDARGGGKADPLAILERAFHEAAPREARGTTSAADLKQAARDNRRAADGRLEAPDVSGAADASDAITRALAGETPRAPTPAPAVTRPAPAPTPQEVAVKTRSRGPVEDPWKGAPVNKDMVARVKDPRIARIIEDAARAHGMDPEVAKAIAGIESSGNPNNGNKSYKGLYALSEAEFKKFGKGGDIHDARANADAGMASIKAKMNAFERKYGRPPTPTELYLAHQQGEGGLARHLANPDASAVQNMFKTGEGRKRGIAWCRKAILGNIPTDIRKKLPADVDAITSRQFAAVWGQKLQGIPYEQGMKEKGKVFGAFGPDQEKPVATPPRTDTPVKEVQAVGPEGETEALKFDRYKALIEGNGGKFHDGVEARNLISLRTPTNTRANGGKGEYDDKTAMLWVDKAGNKHVREYTSNTDPSRALLKASRTDANHDGRMDQGRLPTGYYEYRTENHPRLKHVLRATTDPMVDRDVNQDGEFNDGVRTRGGNSMLFHAGGPQSTGSAGCQTMPPAEFKRFWADLNAAGNPGKVGYTLINQDKANTPVPSPAPVPQATTSGKGMDLGRELSSPDSALSVAIGNAEGNRTPGGGKTASFEGHVDPGNKRHNMGTFSFQAYQDRSVKTPEQADQAQLAVLRSRIPAYQAACRKAGVDADNPLLQAAFFDLSNQTSPRIWQRFLDRMDNLKGKPLTLETLVHARVDAMFDDRGDFTAVGLKNPARAEEDQRRRMDAMVNVLQRRGVL